MAYTPTNWEDRQVAKPMTFVLVDNGDGTTTLFPSESTVFVEGTQINALRLNNMESGIANSVQKDDYINHAGFGITTNTGNDYKLSLTPSPTGYVDGMVISIKANTNSTGNATINVNNLGAKPITTSIGDPFTDIKTNGIYTMRYNSSTGNFILQGEGGVSSTILNAAITDINSILRM